MTRKPNNYTNSSHRTGRYAKGKQFFIILRMPTEFRERWSSCDEVTQGYPVKFGTGFVVTRKNKDTCYSHACPLHSRGNFAFSTRLWSTCSENFYLKMVCQNDITILLIYSLKRTNSVLQEHEEALKKKKEMVLNKTQLTRQDY